MSEVVEKIVVRFRRWHSLGRAGVHGTALARYSRNLCLEFRIRLYQSIRGARSYSRPSRGQSGLGSFSQDSQTRQYQGKEEDAETGSKVSALRQPPSQGQDDPVKLEAHIRGGK